MPLISSQQRWSPRPCCPILCPFEGCRRTIWLYNSPSHVDHNSNDMPENPSVGEAEKNAVMKFKCT